MIFRPFFPKWRLFKYQNGAQKYGVNVQYLNMICFVLFVLNKKLCSFFIDGIMLTLSSFRYNCFKVLQKKTEPRHSDDETPVKLGRT